MASSSDVFGDGRMIADMQATLDQALNTQGYKGGAFRGRVNRKTPPLDALSILLASELVTEQEKAKAFRPWKEALVRFYSAGPNATDLSQKMMLMMGCMKWCEVFEDDSGNRGEYVPPMTIQVFNDDGTVGETHTIDREGSIQVTKGGRAGEVPGAPDRFNKAQRKNFEDIDDKSDAQATSMLYAGVDAEEEAGVVAKDKDDAAGIDATTDTRSQQGTAAAANEDKQGLSLGNDLGKLKLQGLGKKGRREAAKAAKKAAKKMGKKANTLA